MNIGLDRIFRKAVIT